MIRPEDVGRAAARKSNQNMRFRTFLKREASPDILDEQFMALHKELFSDYDCSKCRNCCKKLSCTVKRSELRNISGELGISIRELKDKYLEDNEEEDTYVSKSIPCDFLMEDGSCRLGDSKPELCKDYPYTMRSDRIGSLYSLLENAAVCPVVFEMIERLKKIYKFR